MTIDVVDASLHVASFPATYTGLGTKIGNPKTSLNGDSHQFYHITSGGNAIQILCGFPPRRVRVVNATDGIVWEWVYGMPAANSLKTVISGPTITQDTGSAITIAGDQTTPQDSNIASVTLSATLAGSAKNLCVELVG